MFQQMMSEFSQLPQVDAILLAGSRGAKRADKESDYDVYIYLNAELPQDTRKEIASRYCRFMEINNQFWETEDDGELEDGTGIELIYRSLDWLEAELIRVVEQHQASTGYSTCLWANLLDSQILFDRLGKAGELQERFRVAYPAKLKQAIVDKNHPLLTALSPAYYFQLEKALKRNDLVSVQHRTTELLASYFDIVFALNELPHPGEKRLLQILSQECRLQPENAEQDVLTLIAQSGQGERQLLGSVSELTKQLDKLLQAEGLLAASTDSRC